MVALLKSGKNHLNTTLCIGSIVRLFYVYDRDVGFKYNTLYRFNELHRSGGKRGKHI